MVKVKQTSEIGWHQTGSSIYSSGVADVNVSGNITSNSNIILTKDVNHSISINTATTGNGKHLTIKAADANGEQLGGSLYLVAGLSDGAKGNVSISGFYLNDETSIGIRTIGIKSRNENGTIFKDHNGYSHMKVLGGNNDITNRSSGIIVDHELYIGYVSDTSDPGDYNGNYRFIQINNTLELQRRNATTWVSCWIFPSSGA